MLSVSIDISKVGFDPGWHCKTPALHCSVCMCRTFIIYSSELDYVIADCCFYSLQPIPYWLYKLHGLNINYNCEICGNYTYRGPKAFQRHFAVRCCFIKDSLLLNSANILRSSNRFFTVFLPKTTTYTIIVTLLMTLSVYCCS